MLEDLKIVELATMIAAPTAAVFLADWGAQVIKIEPHRGDPMRGGPGSALGSINYDLANRNKRSIALDTSTADTRAIILKLVATADIFITNMLPDQLEKLDLTWETLHPLNPRMVYGAVSSFGRTGPHRNRGATDNLGFWARGGGTGLLTVQGQDPLPIRQSVGDRITGVVACAGILAATLEAQRTGKGRFIDTSLLAAGMFAFSTDIANQMNRGRTATSKGRRGAVMPLSNYFKTRDGRWVQLHTTLGQLAPALGRPELAEDPRFAGLGASKDDNAALVDIVDAVIAGFDYADLAERFDRAEVRWEPVNTPATLAEDVQVLATGRLMQVDDGQWQVASPWSMVDEDGEVRQLTATPPALGAHTVEILQELGYGEADVSRMRANGTILPHV